MVVQQRLFSKMQTIK